MNENLLSILYTDLSFKNDMLYERNCVLLRLLEDFKKHQCISILDEYRLNEIIDYVKDNEKLFEASGFKRSDKDE